jgi:hypothetical protein
LQLWHVGRLSHPDYLGGALPIAPSAIAPKGHVNLMRPMRDYVVPRALSLNEIPGIIGEFRRGAENAKRAASRFAAPTATCLISSYKTAPTTARMPMGALSKIAPG